MNDDLNTHCVTPVNGTDDREARSKFWVAAYTRPRSEKKSALELSKIGIETYVPIQKQLKMWSDRKKLVDVPVIPMIIFACISEENILMIKAHSLVIKIISLPGKKEPAQIPSAQIENLKFMLNQTDIPVSFEQGHFDTDDVVKIVRGKLKGLVGQVRAVKEDMTELWMSIDMLGGAIMKIKSSELEHMNKELH